MNQHLNLLNFKDKKINKKKNLSTLQYNKALISGLTLV